MSPEDKMAAQPVEPGTDAQQDDSQPLEGGAEAQPDKINPSTAASKTQSIQGALFLAIHRSPYGICLLHLPAAWLPPHLDGQGVARSDSPALGQGCRSRPEPTRRARSCGLGSAISPSPPALGTRPHLQGLGVKAFLRDVVQVFRDALLDGHLLIPLIGRLIAQKALPGVRVGAD